MKKFAYNILVTCLLALVSVTATYSQTMIFSINMVLTC